MAIWIVVGLLVIIAVLLLLILDALLKMAHSALATAQRLGVMLSRQEDSEEANRSFHLLNMLELHTRRIANRHGLDGDPRNEKDYDWDHRDDPPRERPLY